MDPVRRRKHIALHRGPEPMPVGPAERWSMDWVHQFTSNADALAKIDAWRVDDNQRPPHGSLGHLTQHAPRRQHQRPLESRFERPLSRLGTNVTAGVCWRCANCSEVIDLALLSRRKHSVFEVDFGTTSARWARASGRPTK